MIDAIRLPNAAASNGEAPAAIAQTVWENRSVAFPKPVDITIDYLRTGRAVTSYASARLARQGRRVVNVHATMWQDDEAKPEGMPFACWMPYQKGQAAKTEALEAKVAGKVPA